MTKSYFFGGKLVAQKKGSASLVYFHQDHLTGTSVMSDSSGASQGTVKYFPFGGTRSTSGTIPTDKKFTGQRLDGTGLYFYNARYYNPEIGRFVSADTISSSQSGPQSLNRYSYVYNNPLKYSDPSGHIGCMGGSACSGPCLYCPAPNLPPHVLEAQIAYGEWVIANCGRTPSCAVPASIAALGAIAFVAVITAPAVVGYTVYRTITEKGKPTDDDLRNEATKYLRNSSLAIELDGVLGNAKPWGETSRNRIYRKPGGTAQRDQDFEKLAKQIGGKIRTEPNGSKVAEGTGADAGTTINSHASTAEGGTPSIEIDTKGQGKNVKIRYDEGESSAP